MLAFRSLDPFRALREPDRRRRDEERLSRSEQRTLSKTQNNHLTGKAPYKFESISLQRGVRRELDSTAAATARGSPAGNSASNTDYLKASHAREHPAQEAFSAASRRPASRSWIQIFNR